MEIGPEETQLVGAWFMENGESKSNEACKRIYELIRTHLKLVATDWSGWERLYCDPDGGRYWELSFPFGALQAGGPPTLTRVDREAVREKYKLSKILDI